MVTTLNNSLRGVDDFYRVKKSIVLSFDFNSTGANNFALWPAGALMTHCTVFVDTAFNATTTNTLSIGLTGSATYFVNATSITSQGVVIGVIQSTAQTTGASTLTYTYTQTGTAASTGKAYVCIDYVVPRAGVGNVGPPGLVDEL
jgi:hypothetical protein